MPVPSRRLKELIEGTVDHHASQRWPALEEVTISWRGSYGYLTGYLSEDDEWAFAIWQASTDSYTGSVLLNGRPAGHPSQALDTACTLYLTDTSDQQAEPLKELRGAAIVRNQAGPGTRYIVGLREVQITSARLARLIGVGRPARRVPARAGRGTRR
jgi:hypothetical protein